MAAGVTRKISAASARAHTRKSKQKSSVPVLPSDFSYLDAWIGIFKKILVVFFIGFLAWAYQATRPPPPKPLGSPDGAPVTAPRIKLRDGRHLAYKEHGVSKDKAKYKIVFVHGFHCCRHDVAIMATLSQDLIESLGIYIVSFDRPGYGESDPNPNRTLQSMASDLEELADQLELGSKFYVVGFSMGGQALWPSIKYIPHRLAGAALLAPVVNYWWPGFPANLSNEAYNQQLPQDQWALRVSHYAAWLTYWWNTQKLFPPAAAVAQNPAVLSRQDLELMGHNTLRRDYEAQIKQQGEYESLHRDLIIGFGKWEFDPMDLENPFPNNEGSVHIWQGDEDLLVPASLQKYIAKRLPWIHYHELAGAGHMFPLAEGMGDNIVKALVSGKSAR
ncbi:uncharacterized protein [Coffea arabica]|uniref:Uncharacterized protein isoform X1 n=1 Tax=Coffea arabica TaxID=13443 RepID=A0A6P6SM00_COFAR|nr:uncharacterized protein LOC113692642 isoform X1 [Coffea arabica]